MGADYCWSRVEVPPECVTIDHDLPYAFIDVEAFEKYLLDVLALTTPEARRSLGEELLGLDADNDTDRDIEETWKRAIGIVVRCAAGERRDASWSVVGNMVIVHSGGVTWGDSPTDAFDAIVAVDALEWEARR